MSAEGPYNESVRRRFAAPAHAGDLDEVVGRAIRAAAGDAASGLAIELRADVADGCVRQMRFRARGCPHLIALLDGVCEKAEGAAVREIEGLVAAVAEPLEVPRSKAGRLFLVEDGLRSIIEQYEGNQD